MRARRRVVTGPVRPGRVPDPKRTPTVRRIRSAIVGAAPSSRPLPPAGPASSAGVLAGGAPAGRGSAGPGEIDVDLSVVLGGRSPLQLRSPILLAAGCAGYGPEIAEVLELDRLGAIVTRTTTLRPRDGAPAPRLVELPTGLLWATGLPNPGLEAVIERIAPSWPRLPTAVVVSIGGDGPSELAELTRRLEDVPGIAALELNLAELGPGPAEIGALAALVAAARRATGRPLIVKVPNTDAPGRLGRALVEAGADILAGPGGVRGRAIRPGAGNGARRRSALGTGRGFLAGPILLPLALDLVTELAAAVRVPVIGLGGVRTIDDVLDHLAAGATAVGIGSAALGDPDLPGRLVDELRASVAASGSADVGSFLARLRGRPGEATAGDRTLSS